VNPLPEPVGIYAILDAGAFDPGRIPVAAEDMACAGIRVFQVRAKALPAGPFGRLVAAVRSTLPPEALLIVNDRADLALAGNADGVHVGHEDLPVEVVRRVLPAGATIGLSTHTLDEVRDGGHRDCDYLGFGPVFESPTKVTGRAPHGVAGVRAACEASTRPVVAIGGIGLNTVRSLRQAGVSGVAMISSLLVPGRVRELSERAVQEFGDP